MVWKVISRGKPAPLSPSPFMPIDNPLPAELWPRSKPEIWVLGKKSAERGMYSTVWLRRAASIAL